MEASEADRDLTRCPMVARGHVQNGVVVLDEGVRLPEGQEVTVLASGSRISMSLAQGTPHSLVDVPSVSLGEMLCAPKADLLGEMLEGRA